MLFNSQIFVFVFLPATAAGYFLLRRFNMYAASKIFLLAASFIFYAYQSVRYLLLLIGSIAINFLIYKAMAYLELRKKPAQKKAVLITGIVLNLASIFYFKYYDFFITNINLIFKTDLQLLRLALPLGISFFTFQQISFIVDAYMKKAGDYAFADYALFVAFFPQLTAGPIVRHDILIPQFANSASYRMKSEDMLTGLRYFIIGLFKKTMVADRLSMAVTYGYENFNFLSSPAAAMVILAYTLQIYFDFSGYSDMAIGLGKMLGFDIPKNFDMPYKSKNIAEFWDRWHMTMTDFFTRYVYIPLGGSKKGALRTYVNTLAVFLLSGLWHGADWTFVVWGGMHGVMMIFHRVFLKKIKMLPQTVTAFVTYAFVNLAWVLFRADYFGMAKGIARCLLKGGLHVGDTGIYEALCGKNLTGLLSLTGLSLSVQQLLIIVIAVAFMAGAQLTVMFAPSSHTLSLKKSVGRYEGIVLGVMFVLSVMTFMNVSEFLYFNF